MTRQYYWDDLPQKVKEAAAALGYTSHLWDEDEHPPSAEKDWADLNAEERKAAKRLGYDQDKWDRDETAGSAGTHTIQFSSSDDDMAVSYTHLRAHET